MATKAEREARLDAEAATATAKQTTTEFLWHDSSPLRQTLPDAFEASLLPTSILLAAESSQRLIQVKQTPIDRGEADQALRNYALKAPEISRFNHEQV